MVHRQSPCSTAVLLSLFSYLGRVLISLDQTFNTVLGGFPDETLSSRLGRKEKLGDGFATEACKVLDVIEKDHCATSIEFGPDLQADPHHLGKLIHELPRSTARGNSVFVDTEKR